MYRPFRDPQMVMQLLEDRKQGYSFPYLTKKYGLKSHRSVIYWINKYHVVPETEKRVFYHVIPVELASIMRRVVRDFPTRKVRTTPLISNQKIVEKVSWWVVERHVRDHGIQGRPMISFTL